MATPSINDYDLKTNKPLTAADWETNLQTTVNYLTDGAADLSINSLAMVGALNVGTNITATNITATNFIGDGSTITGLNIQSKNWMVNSMGMIRLTTGYGVASGVYGESPAQYHGMVYTTSGIAGTFTNTTGSNIGRTGFAIKFDSVTAVGAGTVNLRYRIPSQDAKQLIGQIVSFSGLVYHNVGSAINYTVTINKANAQDDFSAVTLISASAAQAVGTATSTQILLENVSLGTCGNGIELIISAACGAITTKSFEFTELQLEVSASATAYDYRLYSNELDLTAQMISTTGVGINLGTRKVFYNNTSSSVYAQISTGLAVLNIKGGDVSVEAAKKIYFDGGSNTYIFQSADNTLDVYCDNTLYWEFDGANSLIFAGKSILPTATTAYNLGRNDFVWNEVHYKTLVAHSLKEPVDKVGLMTDKINSINIEDKSSYPIDVYMPASDASAGEKTGRDGTNINQLIVYMIGAIKELTERVKKLEK
jgi:hypothetical protein